MFFKQRFLLLFKISWEDQTTRIIPPWSGSVARPEATFEKCKTYQQGHPQEVTSRGCELTEGEKGVLGCLSVVCHFPLVAAFRGLETATSTMAVLIWNHHFKTGNLAYNAVCFGWSELLKDAVALSPSPKFNKQGHRDVSIYETLSSSSSRGLVSTSWHNSPLCGASTMELGGGRTWW